MGGAYLLSSFHDVNSPERVKTKGPHQEFHFSQAVILHIARESALGIRNSLQSGFGTNAST